MFAFVVLASCVALALGLPQHGALPQLDGRIVGGSDASIEDFPYQISLQYYGSHICGGSIISSRYIVTAAHCTDGQSASSLSIRYGSTTHAHGGNTVRVGAIHQHSGFSMSHMRNDISILELNGDIEFGVGSNVIPLTDSEPQEGDPTICTGWGTTSSGGSIPSTLKKVILPIVSRQDCKAAYGSSQISESMICAGFLGVGGKDACQGDSGGPLVAGGELVGVVSWGYGCADPNYPGVFSNVADLRSFVSQVTGI